MPIIDGIKMSQEEAAAYRRGDDMFGSAWARVAAALALAQTTPKKRGRPRKHPAPAPVVSGPAVIGEGAVPVLTWQSVAPSPPARPSTVDILTAPDLVSAYARAVLGCRENGRDRRCSHVVLARRHLAATAQEFDRAKA